MVRLGGSNVEVSGLTLDGLNSPLVVDGIYQRNSSGIDIHDIRIKDIGDTGAFGPHGILFDGVTERSSKTTRSITG